MKTLKLLLWILCLSSFPLQAQHKKPSNKALDYSGKDMTDYNFTTMAKDALVGAKFVNSILNGCQFANMNLTNADFTGAIMGKSQKGPVSLAAANLDHTIFQKADMKYANLQYATFTATDFTNAQLIGALFGLHMMIKPASDKQRTKFVGTIVDLDRFPIRRWPTVYWSYTDLSNSRINGLTSSSFSFANKDITGAMMKGNNFTNFNFRNCIMTGADLSGSDMSYTDVSGATLYNAKFIGTHFNYANLSNVKCYNTNNGGSPNFSGAVMNNATLYHGDFTTAVMSGVSFLGAVADSCIFDKAFFQSNDPYNVADFSGSDISYSSFNSSAVNAVNFTNVYAIKTLFQNSTLQNTNFTGAVMPLADFSSSSLQGVIFANAILQNAKFNSTTIQSASGGAGVDFSCSQLGGADFTSAKVTSANFADAVMIPRDSCCQQLDGYHCGTITINQEGYGATILPKLSNAVTCPNGDNAQCQGSQWIVPGWNTTHCNPQHVAQVVWTKPSCNNNNLDTTGVIQFTDPNLKQAIIDYLFKGDATKKITRTLAAQVLVLDCSNHNITNLGGLENFTAIRTLDLSRNKLTDGSFFQKLNSLNTLRVAYNNLSGNLNLSGDTQLLYLDASNNAITAIKFDPDCALAFVDASVNQITQLDFSQQVYLNYLDLSNNKLTTVGDLSSLKYLTTIFLQNNSLTTIGNLKTIFANGTSFLTCMDLACNLPFNCSSLGLGATAAEKDFLKYSKCGVNTGCNNNKRK